MVDTTDAVQGAGNLPFQSRGVQAKRDGCREGGGGVGELGLLSKAWGGQNENLFTQIPRREDVSKSRRVLGYDANALYPSTMPCAKEVVGSWPQTPGNVEKFIDVLQRDSLASPRWTSRFPESCGRSSKKCRRYFIPNPSQARQCRSIWKTTWRAASSSPCTTKEGWLAPFQHQKSWCTRRCLSSTSTMVYKSQRFPRTIDYVPLKIFTWFVNKVMENRPKGDQNPEQALLADVFKLLENS